MAKIIRNKRIKKIIVRNEISFKEKIENFLHSDTAPATVTKILLGMAGLGLLIFGGAIIPGILKAMKSLESSGGGNGWEEPTKKEARNALGNLKRQKLIKIIKEKNGKFKIKLTNKGKKRLLKLSLENISLRKPKKWDGKWRIVIFDVPTDANPAREALRRKIKNLGLKQLQKSVWVYPHDCEDEILFVAEAFGVEECVEIITAERVLHEKVLRKAFNV